MTFHAVLTFFSFMLSAAFLAGHVIVMTQGHDHDRGIQFAQTAALFFLAGCILIK